MNSGSSYGDIGGGDGDGSGADGRAVVVDRRVPTRAGKVSSRNARRARSVRTRGGGGGSGGGYGGGGGGGGDERERGPGRKLGVSRARG